MESYTKSLITLKVIGQHFGVEYEKHWLHYAVDAFLINDDYLLFDIGFILYVMIKKVVGKSIFKCFSVINC